MVGAVCDICDQPATKLCVQPNCCHKSCEAHVCVSRQALVQHEVELGESIAASDIKTMSKDNMKLLFRGLSENDWIQLEPEAENYTKQV